MGPARGGALYVHPSGTEIRRLGGPSCRGPAGSLAPLWRGQSADWTRLIKTGPAPPRE